MPVDTVALVSRDVIPYEAADEILVRGRGHLQVNNEDGRVVFERHIIRVPGSWDSNCNVSLVRAPSNIEVMEYGDSFIAHHGGYNVRIEGSPAKLAQGHNVQGGPGTLREAQDFMVGMVERIAEYPLAGFGWDLARLDWAENFVFPSREEAELVIRHLTKVRMARKDNRPFEGESIESVSRSWTWKAYWKGPEFHVHDRPRLVREGFRDLTDLINLAYRTVRVECEFKKPWLEYHRKTQDVQKLPENWQEEWEVHTKKALQGDVDLRRTTDPLEVRYRLNKRFSQKQAAALFGTWSDIIMNGEAVAKQAFVGRMSTWYDHKKKLKDTGIALFGVTCKVEDRMCDFTLSSPFRARCDFEQQAA